MFKEARFLHLLAQLVGDFLVAILEDGAAEFLYLGNDIPRAVVGDAFHDVAYNPLQDDIGGVQVGNQLVDGNVLYLVVVEPDAEIGG